MVGEEKQNHLMILQTTHDFGIDEWYCPKCGRRFLIQMLPDYKRIILDPGDENSLHSGSVGGLKIQETQIHQRDQDASLDDPYLAPWQEWLDQIDLDSRWKRKD